MRATGRWLSDPGAPDWLKRESVVPGLRLVPIVLVSAALLVACGSSGSPTEGPGNGGGGGGNPTATPAGGGGGGEETQAPGGGGGSKPAGWDRYGKVTYTISGPASASGELGFSPAGSVFAGQQVSLSFFDDASQTIVTMRFDGSTAFAQYGGSDLTFSSESCTTKDLQLQAGSASGSFDCTGVAIVPSGALLTGAKMTGTFTAKVT
jgi:hypothetical protein